MSTTRVLQAEGPVSRRELLSASASLSLLLAAAPAQAFLGFGEDTVQTAYTQETVSRWVAS